MLWKVFSPDLTYIGEFENVCSTDFPLGTHINNNYDYSWYKVVTGVSDTPIWGFVTVDDVPPEIRALALIF